MSKRKIILAEFEDGIRLVSEKPDTIFYFINDNYRSQKFTDLTKALKARVKDQIKFSEKVFC